jgi:hypothetical protein
MMFITERILKIKLSAGVVNFSHSHAPPYRLCRIQFYTPSTLVLPSVLFKNVGFPCLWIEAELYQNFYPVQEPHKMMQLRNIDRKEQNPYNRNNP